MGPRSFDRGKGDTIRVDGMGAYKLQWGRDLSIAERCHPARGSPSHGSLQWGRDLSIAESWGPPENDVKAVVASMGPRSFDRGKTGCRSFYRATASSFNGAAIFRSRKAGNLPETNGLSRWLQWGRDLSIAERRATRRWTPSLVALLQWGRDLSIAESPTTTTRECYLVLLQWGRDLSIAERTMVSGEKLPNC